MPLSLEELIPTPIPDEENAAVELWKLMEDRTSGGPMTKAIPALDRYQDLFALDRPDLIRAATMDDEQAEALLRQLREPPLADALALAERMGEKPGYVPPLDWSQGHGIVLTHLSLARSLARLLCLRAWLEAQQGDTAAACRDFSLMFRLSAHLEREPILISQLVAIAVDSIAVDGIQATLRSLDEDRFGPEELAGLVAAIQPRRHPGGNPRLVDALNGEYAMMTDLYGKLVKGRLDLVPYLSDDGQPEPRNRGMVVLAPLLLDDLAWATDKHILLRQQANLPQLEAAQLDVLKGRSLRHFVSRMMLIGVTTAYRKFNQHDAKLAIAQAGLRVLAYRQEHGRYPTEDEVAAWDGWPTDPFTGKPVRYQLSEGGYKIWGAGTDGVDNGGVRRVRNQPGDELWEIGGAGDAVE